MCGELLQFCPISNVDFLSFPFKSQFRSGAIGMDSHLVYQREREREEKELVNAFPVALIPALIPAAGHQIVHFWINAKLHIKSTLVKLNRLNSCNIETPICQSRVKFGRL